MFLSEDGSAKCFDSNTAPTGIRIHSPTWNNPLQVRKIPVLKINVQISQKVCRTDPKFAHCPSGPGRGISCTPRPNSSSSSTGAGGEPSIWSPPGTS
eukprot:7287181-Pyramimonas_sp.AAC.1